jgi:hypothetical protein
MAGADAVAQPRFGFTVADVGQVLGSPLCPLPQCVCEAHVHNNRHGCQRLVVMLNAADLGQQFTRTQSRLSL